MQNHFNGEEENNTALIALMKKYKMPYRAEDIEIEKSNAVFDKYIEKLCNSSAIETEEEARRLESSMKYLWNIK